jgi:hypothetical protein
MAESGKTRAAVKLERMSAQVGCGNPQFSDEQAHKYTGVPRHVKAPREVRTPRATRGIEGHTSESQFGGGENRSDLHGATASGAPPGCLARGNRVGFTRFGREADELAAQRERLVARGIGEIAVVPDAHEAARQNMLHVTAQNLVVSIIVHWTDRDGELMLQVVDLTAKPGKA